MDLEEQKEAAKVGIKNKIHAFCRLGGWRLVNNWCAEWSPPPSTRPFVMIIGQRDRQRALLRLITRESRSLPKIAPPLRGPARLSAAYRIPRSTCRWSLRCPAPLLCCLPWTGGLGSVAFQTINLIVIGANGVDYASQPKDKPAPATLDRSATVI
ncbi:unnamed protein product [Soboliphyme baturini]|uniref:Uncharacterized protein n=1 Tax=Soboliphyme baturini TaxID=241478 RepID=A0A183ICQ0_9BILA|nr:unnamed protein product [Soboliphyme baturini]